MVGRPNLRSKSGRETLPKVWIGLKTLREVWYWSGDPPGVSVLVGILTRRSESGRETILEVRKWSGHPLGGPEVVGRPNRRSESGRETLPKVWKWNEYLREVWHWSGD